MAAKNKKNKAAGSGRKSGVVVKQLGKSTLIAEDLLKAKTSPGKGDVLVKNLGKSTLIEEDFQKTAKGLDYSEPSELKGERKPQLFYRNFVFKCEKCIHEFKHESAIPIIEHKVVCPKCSEVHVVRVIPVTRHYELQLPKGLKAIRHSKK
jgi:Zn finger protein HypA/HybF involved in hydrogenase expression